jgi:L-ectoine synthase
VIVRNLDQDVLGSDREVKAETFVSRRLLLRADGVGFSFHDTILFAGSETHIWYQHHLEAVYCIGGEGELEVVGGEVHAIRPGTFYALDGHEEHFLRATSDLRMMCVFSPALTGKEVHDSRGVYPPPEEMLAAVAE